MANRVTAGCFATSALLGALLTAIPGAADAPPGRYEIKSDTVTDTETGLVWQRGGSMNSLTWPEAAAYCAGLPLDGGGWRLPRRTELTTLVDVGKAGAEPAIDLAAFPDVALLGSWSSSTLAGNGGQAWYIDFSQGITRFVGTDGAMLRARCVR